MKKRNQLLFIIFITIVTISIFLFSYGSDFFWHLKIGEYITTHQKIPFTDLFSWYGTQNHLPWISHEWLFEVILFEWFHYGKQFGIFIMILLLLIATSSILWKQNSKVFTRFPFQTILWGILGMLMFANKTMPRPHLFSYLFFALTIYICYDTYQNKQSKKIYIAPILSILWSNIHGGSSNLSYLIYSFFLLSYLNLNIKYFKKDNLEKTQIKKFLYAFFSSILAILINPHGIKMLFYPYLNMTYHTMITCIEEWQSLSLYTIDGWFYLLFIIGITITIVHSKKKITQIDFLLLLSFTFLGIKSTRMMPYLYIVSTSIIPKYWINNKIKITLTPVLISIVSIIILFYTTIYQSPNFHIVSKEMITYLKKEKTILYNSYELGGYLIYQNIPVFVDGRADLYIDTILCDVCEIEQGKGLNKLEKYPFNTFIVKRNTKLENYLSNNQQYELKYKDQQNALYILKKDKTKSTTTNPI